MQLPGLPLLRPLETVSPTTYEAALKCRARAAWSHVGDRDVLPQHPASVLGQSFHAVMAAANRGELGDTPEHKRGSARRLFQQSARDLFAESHALMQAKFRSAEELPFFNLSCEQASLLAARVVRRTAATASGDAHMRRGSPQRRTEARMFSVDRRIVGRLDHINQSAEAVVDYKSGRGGSSLTDRERRQLRLYAFLAMQNGITITRGILVRGNGISIEENIATADAESEAANAVRVMTDLNNAIGQGASFAGLASPAGDICADCPCIPFCEPFWERASTDWKDSVGCHVEGRLRTIERTAVRGSHVLGLSLDITRGTTTLGPGNVQAFPEVWLAADGSPLPSAGDLVRFVGARVAEDGAPLMIYVDRIGTTVWTTGT